MARKKKSTERPELPKEYIWTLEVEGKDREFKCLVTEEGVTTYEDGVEHKHLKITDPTCMEGVLQIDCETKIFGDMVPFQLERFIPYIKLEDRWVMSHTTEKDRMDQQIAIYKKQSKQETITGIGAILVVLAKQLITGDIGDWWMLTVFGIFFISSAAYRMVRLRNEINALKEIEAEAAAEKAAMEELENMPAIPSASEEE